MIYSINSLVSGNDSWETKEAQVSPLTQVILPATPSPWALASGKGRVLHKAIHKRGFSWLPILFVVPFLISSLSLFSLSANSSDDLDKSFVAVSVSFRNTGVQMMACGVDT